MGWKSHCTPAVSKAAGRLGLQQAENVQEQAEGKAKRFRNSALASCISPR